MTPHLIWSLSLSGSGICGCRQQWSEKKEGKTSLATFLDALCRVSPASLNMGPAANDDNVIGGMGRAFQSSLKTERRQQCTRHSWREMGWCGWP